MNSCMLVAQEMVETIMQKRGAKEIYPKAINQELQHHVSAT